MSSLEYLEQVTGKKHGEFGEKPTMLDLCDDVVPTGDTPDDVLLAIVGKALMKVATKREWTAFKYLTAKYGNDVDQAIEIRTFIDTH